MITSKLNVKESIEFATYLTQINPKQLKRIDTALESLEQAKNNDKTIYQLFRDALVPNEKKELYSSPLCEKIKEVKEIIKQKNLGIQPPPDQKPETLLQKIAYGIHSEAMISLRTSLAINQQAFSSIQLEIQGERTPSLAEDILGKFSREFGPRGTLELTRQLGRIPVGACIVPDPTEEAIRTINALRDLYNLQTDSNKTQSELEELSQKVRSHPGEIIKEHLAKKAPIAVAAVFISISLSLSALSIAASQESECK